MENSFRVLLYRTCLALLSLIVIYAIFYRWFDRPDIIWLNHHLQHDWVHTLSTHLGNIFKPFHWFALGIICFIIGAFIYQYKQKFEAGYKFLYFGGSLIGAFVACFVFKVIIARYRPDLFLAHGLYGFHYFSIKHDFNSTPSGHATLAFAGFFALSKLSKSKLIALIFTLIALVIGLSRLVMLAHFPSDIVFGIYVGILSVYYWEFILGKVCKRLQ